MLVLLVTPERFRLGLRNFLRELSATLEIIAFVKKTDDGDLIIKPFELPAEVVVARSRRQARNVNSVISHAIVRRAQDSSVG